MLWKGFSLEVEEHCVQWQSKCVVSWGATSTTLRSATSSRHASDWFSGWFDHLLTKSGRQQIRGAETGGTAPTHYQSR